MNTHNVNKWLIVCPRNFERLQVNELSQESPARDEYGWTFRTDAILKHKEVFHFDVKLQTRYSAKIQETGSP